MTSLLLACSILLSGCASTTVIQSTPAGARVYLNDIPVGTTPYTHRDTRIVGTSTSLTLEKEGYDPFYTSFSRNEEVDIGAVIGGIFFVVPFLWVMKYKPTHTYELAARAGNEPVPATSIEKQQQNQTKSTKVERLRELKQLLDEQLITREEYEEEKKKILEEGDE